MLPLRATPSREAPLLLEEETRARTCEKRSPTHSEADASPAPFTWGSESTSTSPSPAPGANHRRSRPAQKTFARSVAPRMSGTNHLAQKSRTASTLASGVRLLSTSTTESPPPNVPPSPVRSIIDFYLGSSPPPRQPTPYVPSGQREGEPAECKDSADGRAAALSSSSSSSLSSPAPPRAYIEEFLALTEGDEIGELPQVEAASLMRDSGSAALDSTSPPPRAVGVALDNSPIVQEMWEETSSSATTSSAAVSDGFEKAEDAQPRRRSGSVARIHLSSSSPNSPLSAQLTASPMQWRRSGEGTPPPQGDEAHALEQASTMVREKHATSRTVGAEAPSSVALLAKKVRMGRNRSRRPLSSSRDGHQCEAVERVLRFPFCTAQEDAADIQSVREKEDAEKGEQVASAPLHVTPVVADVVLDHCSARRQGGRSPFVAPTSVGVEKCVMTPSFTGSQESNWRSAWHVSVGRGQLTGSRATGTGAAPQALSDAYNVPVEMPAAVERSYVATQGVTDQTTPHCSVDGYAPLFPMCRSFVEPPLRRHVEIPLAASERCQPPRYSAKKRNVRALLERLYPGRSLPTNTGAGPPIPFHDKRSASQVPQRTTDPPPPRWNVSTKIHYSPAAGETELANAGRNHSSVRHGSQSKNSDDYVKERPGSLHRRRSGSAPAKAPLHTRTSLLRLEATKSRKAAEAALREEIESPSFHPTVAPHSARICRDKLRELKTAAGDAAAALQRCQPGQASRTAHFQSEAKPRQGMCEEALFWGDGAAIADVSVSSSDGASAQAARPSGSSGTSPATAQPFLPQVAESVGTSFNVGAHSYRNAIESRACRQARQQQRLQGRKREAQPHMETGHCRGASPHVRRQPTKDAGYLEQLYPQAPASKGRTDTSIQCNLLLSESMAAVPGAECQLSATSASASAEDAQGLSGGPMEAQMALQRVDLYSTAPIGAVEARETWSERQQRVEDRLLQLEAERQCRLAVLRRVTSARDSVTGHPLFKPFTGR
ncbi:hypothetical protein LSCM4_00915 [Leishmania orientalis]|uniref:Uncharacterized protein n=1 Tax=Leishmania orientalis TaxID=2249476 RepID=A0A836GZX1_9TRYP|nr:hypothetical protein LSCM4_00915 [Leishmania orientalis]